MEQLKNRLLELANEKAILILERNEMLRSEEDKAQLTGEEKEIVNKLTQMSIDSNGFDIDYDQGCFVVEFNNKEVALNFLEKIDKSQGSLIDDYDVFLDDGIEKSDDDYFEGDEFEVEEEEIDWNEVNDSARIIVSCYLDPEKVVYGPYYAVVSEDFDDENGELFEVRRRIKINFKGLRVIKMQCKKGFKWDSKKRACVKITGVEKASMRKRMRKMIRTKKSKGPSFWKKINRKRNRAMKRRKGMGVKNYNWKIG